MGVHTCRGQSELAVPLSPQFAPIASPNSHRVRLSKEDTVQGCRRRHLSCAGGCTALKANRKTIWTSAISRSLLRTQPLPAPSASTSVVPVVSKNKNCWHNYCPFSPPAPPQRRGSGRV